MPVTERLGRLGSMPGYGALCQVEVTDGNGGCIWQELMCCARQKKYQKCVVVCFRMFLNSIEDGRLCVFGARLTSLYTMRLTLSASKNQKLFVILNTLDVCQRSVLEDLCFMLSNWSWRTGLDLYPSRLDSHPSDNVHSNRCFKVGESQAEHTLHDYRNPIHFIPNILFFPKNLSAEA